MSLFITFEGIDGCGKTTHLALLESYLREKGYDPLMPREPGGTALGEQIRPLLLNKASYDISPESELLLFLASRAQICRELIRPALEVGRLVICDRFMDSSVAYQGYGRGLGPDLVSQFNNFATAGLTPDLTFLLDLDPQLASQRIDAREMAANRLDAEGLAFQTKVRQGFLELARQNPDRIVLIDTAGDKEVAQNQIRHAIGRFLA